MNQKWKCLLFLLLQLILPHELFSQDLMFKNISVEDGLSNNFVTSIHQDSRGYMWFGTLDGIDRFDGAEIRSYASKFPQQPVKVNCITDDPEQGIWIGTDIGLFYWDFIAEDFEQVPLTENTESVNSLLFLPGDTLLLAGTNAGIWLLNSGSSHAELLQVNDGVESTVNVTDAIIHGNNVWVSTTSSIMKISLSDFHTQTFINEGSSSSFNNFSSLTAYNDTIIAGTQTRGLFKFDTTNNTFTPFADVGYRSILVIEYDNNGHFYIGTDGGGLIILDTNDYSYKTYRKEVNYPNTLTSNAIYSLLIDSQGRFWAGTYSGGVSYNTSHDGTFQVSAFENNLFLGQNSIRSLYYDDNNNKHIGTRLGLYVSKSTGETLYLDKENSALKSNVILSIDKHKNDILIGTFRGGVSKIDIHTNKVEPFNRNVLPASGSVYGFEHDQDGNLLIATMEGLYIQDINTGAIHHFTAGNSELSDSRLIAIRVDSQERIWLGSISAGTSIYKLENNQLVQVQDHLKLSEYKAVSFYEDSGQNIWIASEQGGLVKVTHDLNEKEVYTTEYGLPNNSVTAITEAPVNTFWVSTLKGFARLDISTDRFYSYTLSHGLPSLVFNRGAIINDYKNSGRVWLGTESGLVSFSPDDIQKNKADEKITITDFFVAGESYLPPDSNKPAEQINKIQLKGNQSSIGFRFIALNYFNPSDNQYLYRLSGFEDEWKKSSGNQVTYPNLKPGKYTFQVRLAGTDDSGEPQIASVDIQVKPYWYQQTAFQFLIAICILLVVILTIKAIIDLKRRIHKIQDSGNNTKDLHKKYETSSLSTEKSLEIKNLLKSHVEETKIYLNPDLKLNDLAAAINCSPHDVSQVINQNMNQSYYEFINRYRIEDVKKCMADPAYKKYTLLAIAQECGFNSKTSFYRAFKKLTGLTPIQYQNELNKTQVEN